MNHLSSDNKSLATKVDELKAEVKYFKKIQKAQGNALKDKDDKKSSETDKIELKSLRKENAYLKSKVHE